MGGEQRARLPELKERGTMRTSSTSRALRVLAICGALCGATTAQAQGVGFGRASLAVLNAANFIGDYHSGDYYYGNPLTMTVRDDALAQWAGKRIQARVFVLKASNQDRPDSWKSLADCDVFYTYVSPVARVADNGVLNLGSVNSLGWMRMPDSVLAEGRFLVVFENARDGDPVFRLNRADRESYFRRGVIITASYGATTETRIPSRHWLESDERRRRREMAQISADRICYRFQIAERAAAGTQVAQMQRCPTSRTTARNGGLDS
jgi:hypothetical protein